MSYYNYYLSPVQNNPPINWGNILYYGCLIAGVIILIHILWAYFVNRYDSDRVSGKLYKKFTDLHGSDVNSKYHDTDVQFVTHDAGVMAPDLSTASTNILVNNKRTSQTLSTTPFSLPVKSDCSSMDFNCVNL